MRIGSADRSAVTLQVRDYQFPGLVGSGPRDWDANWVIIEGRVFAADGRNWCFRDPCLTTWEAAELSRWLRAVAAGAIAPTSFGSEPPSSDDFEPVGVLVFTEPTIAFSLASQDGDQVTLRVHLSSGACPPQPSGVRTRLFEYFVSVRLSRVDLETAVEVWNRELAAFPAR